MSEDLVGRVIGLGDGSTTAEFQVVIDGDNYLQLDDLVEVRTQVPKAGEVRIFGLVTEVNALHEGTRFHSDTELVVEGSLPANAARAATVQVIRVTPEVWVAASPGEQAHRAAGESRDKALYVDEMGRPMPVGYARDGQPIWVDLDFFDGRKGGHISVSGISGVATKTSFALAFIRSLTAHAEIAGRASSNMSVLVFNVKQEDLLWLDKPNNRLTDEAREQWKGLGIPATPFPSVSFWAPARDREGEIPDTDSRTAGVSAFSWSVREVVERGLLRFMFTESSDMRNQLTFVDERVRKVLRRQLDEEDQSGLPAGAIRVDDQVIEDLHGLVALIANHLDQDSGIPDALWSGSVAPGTAAAFMRRLYAAEARLGNLICAKGGAVDRRQSAVTVVDIHKLHEFAQRFVVGALLDEVFSEKQKTGQREPLQVVLLDELNKYAPRSGDSPIKEMLVDIAQRGRSLGIILIGAQQSASRVAEAIVENASIKVTGRLDPAEAGRDEYGWMLASTKARSHLFKPGTMVLHQPGIPAPLVFTFPYPPWATRPEEATEGDPFEGL